MNPVIIGAIGIIITVIITDALNDL